MTCPDHPEAAGFLRSAMNHHEDHLEPKKPFDGELGRLKRIIEIQREELATWRENFPDYTYCKANGVFPRRLLYNGLEMYDG